MRHFAVLAALAILPAAADAQNAYRRVPGDTLRYEESMTIASTAATPMGEVTTEAKSEGATIFVFRTTDSVSVTMHPTKMTMKMPSGDYSPDVTGLRGAVFEMVMHANGELRILTRPELPADLAAVSGSVNTVADFFVRLPGRDLDLGAMWTDTIVISDSTAEMRITSRRVASYTVEKDTIIDGRNAWVIAGTGDTQLESTGTLAPMDASMSVSMKVRDSDRAVITRDGTMLLREVLMEQSGTSRIVTLSAPMEMPITGTIALKRRLVL